MNKDNLERFKSVLLKETPILLVHRTEGYEGVWYPQGLGKVAPQTKKWRVTATFGEPVEMVNG